MHTHAEKTTETKSQPVAGTTPAGGASIQQVEDRRPEAVAQRKAQELANNSPQVARMKTFQDLADNKVQAIQRKANNTGLPDQLKTGIESLSGHSMDDVKVHYNSDKPKRLQAHAYAQGTDIHLASGQERHLPHEAWHVVQQKQGRVQPTMQLKGKVAINDDRGLEREADTMGDKAVQVGASHPDAVAQRKEAEIVGGLYAHTAQLRPIPVIQLKTALQGFNEVIADLGRQIGGSLGGILIGLSRLNKIERDVSKENAEQQIFFGTAWKGSENDVLDAGDERVMVENLIQSGLYNIGEALKKSRINSDKTEFLNAEPEAGKEGIYDAFRNALFFRAERMDSKAPENGILRYDSAKHGKSGSASAMPGRNAEKVKERADNYLFVSKNRKEALDYAEKAQGGKRELITMISSRTEVGLMLYDVDSGGYKTPEHLTGVIVNSMTPTALANLNTWLKVPVTKETADVVLATMLS